LNSARKSRFQTTHRLGETSSWNTRKFDSSYRYGV